ncbi:D-serine ammonia-lyase [Pseudalkalibacillus hwajinpoensis]|uniref:Probable D-serine dehydratase n=1 Tax=Guptibacillus hwajinpoensis TaxID=208199 RepID=A0A4U1MIR2_9BACL|nr:D-serine ammonia-lyase [Pseudalkalibacillus hwajinpoensis]TKD70677.1 D-serine ammonia-lyase [Pseudalkalibacillus hwajinpoensis]
MHVLGKPLEKWIQDYPLIEDLVKLKEVVWENPAKGIPTQSELSYDDILEAEARMKRFVPYFQKVFPETNGIIESPISDINSMKAKLEKEYDTQIDGRLLLKRDDLLPIAGSIKARGGIYEVIKHAEKLALGHALLKKDDDYAILADKKFTELFSAFSITVGSTGNLGLSIGIMSAKLGFNVTVHMSSDAKQWKKDLLRKKGVKVVEHKADYSVAVEQGRQQCEKSLTCHFIDDENSKDLFMGYAVAALRLKKQLDEMEIKVDAENPLNVYLPCGVGGAPGGIAFGLHQVFGEYVHCYFAEPTHSPSMLLGLMTGQHDKISVQDFEIDNITAADGLAVGRPSGFVGREVQSIIDGVFTVDDQRLYDMLRWLYNSERIKLEPSALAGMIGPVVTKDYEKNKGGTHLVWATGGKLVPQEMWIEDYLKGK